MQRVCRISFSKFFAFTAIALTAIADRAAGQDVRLLTACTPDALGVCAQIRLTSDAGLFEVGIRTLAATGAPLLSVSVYNLVFGTGSASAITPASTDVTPAALGGAIVTDYSAWEIFDAGDALFLSALSNRGIGGCVGGVDVDGFGQAAQTCSVGQFVTFGFTPTSAFDVRNFFILDFEAVALSDPTQAASCGGSDSPCTITSDVVSSAPPSTTVPEPSVFGMLGVGLAVLAVAARVRER